MPTKPKNGPVMVQVVAGKRYRMCGCGQSSNPPFCDSRGHAGTGKSPTMWTATRSGRLKLCGCACTKRSPLCDNSHLR